MQIIKRILGHLYFFYGIILFALTMLMVVPFILMARIYKEPRYSTAVHNIFKVWMRVFLSLVFCRVRRKGKEHFKKEENYVVVFNHQSFVDIPVSSPWVPGANKTLAKIELSKIPFFGIVYKSGSILVDRKDEHSRRESFTKMQTALKQGLHLTLYPEGTRNKTNKPLQPFYDGAFITAIRGRKQIIPGILFQTSKILPLKPKFWAWPHTIQIHFLAPIATEQYSLREKDVLKDKVFHVMEDYIIQNKP